MNKTVWHVVGIVSASALLLFLISLASASPSLDAGQLVNQAQETMRKAHTETCKKLGSYLDTCFNQGIACDKIDSAVAYHSATFGGDWLTACRPTKG